MCLRGMAMPSLMLLRYGVILYFANILLVFYNISATANEAGSERGEN